MGNGYVFRYILKEGRLKKLKVKRSEALKDVEFILERDKEFLKIMEKM